MDIFTYLTMIETEKATMGAEKDWADKSAIKIKTGWGYLAGKVSDAWNSEVVRDVRLGARNDLVKGTATAIYGTNKVLSPVREILGIVGGQMKGPVLSPYRIIPAYIERRRRRLREKANPEMRGSSLVEKLENLRPSVYEISGNTRGDVTPEDKRNYDVMNRGHKIGKAGNWIVNAGQVVLYWTNPILFVAAAAANVATTYRAYVKYKDKMVRVERIRAAKARAEDARAEDDDTQRINKIIASAEKTSLESELY
jgi:hypothetical protein